MKNENYIVIQGWMRNELNLKGNELLIYALIYGFSQDDESEFNGSVAYIAEWIGSSKQTVYNCLKSLCDKNLLIKNDEYHNGIKFCTYKAFLPLVKNFERVVKNFDQGGKNILPNNISDNIDHNIDNGVLAEIVEYLNQCTGKRYRPNTRQTKSKIQARLNDGYTLDDFKRVIDIKSAEWMGTDMEKYLRPETLFGPKFEAYLNQREARRKMSNCEIAMMLDEAERRSNEQKSSWSDAGESFCGIPEHIPWDG